MEMKNDKENNTTQYVSFIIEEEDYGIDISCVHEIIRFPEITHLPQMPDFFEGVLNLRGHVIPVINLRTRFGFPAKENDRQSRIIVINIGEGTMGIMVDAVDEVLEIGPERVDPAPKMGANIHAEFIRGMAKLDDERLMILLDIDKVLSAEEIDALHEMKLATEPAA